MEQREHDIRQEALEFTKLLAEQYLVCRNLTVLPQVMDEQVSWIGTGGDEIGKNLFEAKEALTRELEEYSGSFSIADQWFEVMLLSDTLCIVYGAVQAVPEDGTLSEESLRLTLVLKKTEEGMRFMHLHLSHPDREQEKGHYFVTKEARTSPVDLRRTLDLRSRQLDILNRNIPGGAHQCKNDPNFTLISMSDSFLSMFGYTREEIHLLFHDNFIEMVYPGDRAALLASSRNQMQMGKDLELEYRVLCKNGPPVWVLDKARLMDDGDGGENFYCLLIEMSERRQAQEELRLSLERHKVIMDQATDIIFEWDIRKDTLSFSPNWRKRFGYDAISTKISGRIPMSENIHPEDMAAFVQIMKDTAAGVAYSEAEFRIKDIDKRYFWCRIRATAQFDSDGRAIKAIGVIVDIDSEKKQKQMLLDMAQRDTLTGLYNKATINSLVELRMVGRDCAVKQALLILDVDYFKQVNDTYGHLAGDSILSDVAAIIRSQIRNTDLSGRIGGDEFLIYLTEVTGEEAVRVKVETLLKSLETLTPCKGAPPISCSIGAAVFPHGGIDFFALYKCADLALYARKNSGRGGVTFYRPGISEKPPSGLSKSAVGADVGSDVETVADEQMAQYAFRILYTATDVDAAIERLLEIIGRSYDVSRVYIFENSEDGSSCSNTFEWCAQGVESKKDIFQAVSYEYTLSKYIKNFNKNGLFHWKESDLVDTEVRAILEARGIRAMLQCATLDAGKVEGCVGFDECRENLLWDAKQIASFKLTADVLSTFVVRHRQKQRLKKD